MSFSIRFRIVLAAALLLIAPVLSIAQQQQQQLPPQRSLPVVPGIPRFPPPNQRFQEPQQQGAQAAQAPQAAQNPQTPPPTGTPTVYGGLNLTNVSLVEVIDLLARQLKINYILDPRVKGGGVILNTYGETKNIDTRSLLETILHINGYGMVKQGDLYRIVPLADISHLPIPPETITNPNSIPEDDQTMLNLVFLKYITADDLAKVLEPFEGENARIFTYSAANLLLMLDSRRSMRRLMQLVAMFDNDQLANKRVRVFTVKHGQPSDISKELDDIFKAVSLSDKKSPIKFLPIDRINSIIAVASNPGVFGQVETWLAKLDIPIKVPTGGTQDYVYRVHYGDASTMACSIQALYGALSSDNPGGSQNAIMACMMMASQMNGMMGGFGGVYGGGMMGGGMMGGGMMGGFGGGMMGGFGGGFGGIGGGYGGFGGGFGAPGMYGGGYGGYGGYGGGYGGYAGFNPATAAANPAAATPGAGDLTGRYLGNASGTAAAYHGPRVIANPMNNTLLIQATPQEYESLQQLIQELDVPPRQVLIEAKIYSVDLSRNFSSNVAAALQTLSGNTPPTPGGGNVAPVGSSITSTAASLLSAFNGGGAAISGATLVGKSRALAGIVQLMETENDAKIISSPSVIATDSIPASISVGTTVPTQAGSVTSGIGGGGVTNAIANVGTGIGLNIIARVSPSGIVTMVINQNISDPVPTSPATSGSSINSPSFGTKSITTQITVQDGDTIAIGGQIQESNTLALGGIPLLDRLPGLGALFGSRNYQKQRSELIMFITPHVIYDSNGLLDASDQLKGEIKDLQKDFKNQ